MKQNGLKFILPVLALSAPIAPAWGQEKATAVEEAPAPSPNPSKDNKRYIQSTADLGEVLRYNGFDFQKETLDGKEYLIVDVDGITTVINLYGADSELDSMQLYAGFIGDKTTTPQRMNEWNSAHRFTRAYIDSEGDPVLEMDLNFAFGGVSERQLEDSLALWELSVVKFRKFIYERDGLFDEQKALIRKLRD